jgi:hypothetical protein
LDLGGRNITAYSIVNSNIRFHATRMVRIR